MRDVDTNNGASELIGHKHPPTENKQCLFEAGQNRGSQRQKGDTERQMDRLTDQSRQVNRRANTAGAIPQRAMTLATASRPGSTSWGASQRLTHTWSVITGDWAAFPRSEGVGDTTGKMR